MIYRRMSIGHVNKTVSYAPVNGEVGKFDPLMMEIPDVKSESEKDTFVEDLQTKLHQCCGKAACESVVSLLHGPIEGINREVQQKYFGDVLWLDGASFSCDAIDCPLRGPSAGDREPRNPSPEPPVLAAELPITSIE